MPVPYSSVHRAIGLEPLPVITGARDGSRFAGKRCHIEHPIHHQSRSCARIAVGVEKVARVEQIPLTVFILEGMRIYRKRKYALIYKRYTCVSIRTERMVGG